MNPNWWVCHNSVSPPHFSVRCEKVPDPSPRLQTDARIGLMSTSPYPTIAAPRRYRGPHSLCKGRGRGLCQAGVPQAERTSASCSCQNFQTETLPKFRFRATRHRVFCEPIVLSDVDLQAGLFMRRGELIRRSNSFSLAIDNLCFLFTVGLAQ